VHPGTRRRGVVVAAVSSEVTAASRPSRMTRVNTQEHEYQNQNALPLASSSTKTRGGGKRRAPWRTSRDDDRYQTYSKSSIHSGSGKMELTTLFLVGHGRGESNHLTTTMSPLHDTREDEKDLPSAPPSTDELEGGGKRRVGNPSGDWGWVSNERTRAGTYTPLGSGTLDQQRPCTAFRVHLPLSRYLFSTLIHVR
jgi:hypothetical protein